MRTSASRTSSHLTVDRGCLRQGPTAAEANGSVSMGARDPGVAKRPGPVDGAGHGSRALRSRGSCRVRPSSLVPLGLVSRPRPYRTSPVPRVSFYQQESSIQERCCYTNSSERFIAVSVEIEMRLCSQCSVAATCWKESSAQSSTSLLYSSRLPIQ